MPAIVLVAIVVLYASFVTYLIGRVVDFRPADFSPFIRHSYFREVVVWYLALAVAIVPFWLLVEVVWRAVRSVFRERSQG